MRWTRVLWTRTVERWPLRSGLSSIVSAPFGQPFSRLPPGKKATKVTVSRRGRIQSDQPRVQLAGRRKVSRTHFLCSDHRTLCMVSESEEVEATVCPAQDALGGRCGRWSHDRLNPRRGGSGAARRTAPRRAGACGVRRGELCAVVIARTPPSPSTSAVAM